jgi:uncharacterized protein YceK
MKKLAIILALVSLLSGCATAPKQEVKVFAMHGPVIGATDEYAAKLFGK